jgi:hypothetical protein
MKVSIGLTLYDRPHQLFDRVNIVSQQQNISERGLVGGWLVAIANDDYDDDDSQCNYSTNNMRFNSSPL